ncbi:MAG: hypothetical protein OEM07_04405, partial [Gammaproteobacteria bacterium]|nr:hypothetical protein [Gammaproteobacteria bacterium]
IAIENKHLAQAKETLAPLLENNSNNAFTIAAIQNRTRIAHAEMSADKSEAIQWTNNFEQKLKATSNQLQKARLARFKANLNDDSETQNKYFAEALNIYRSQTNRPGIAATLQEWADALIMQQPEVAADKLQRALYIRQSLQDRKNCLKILNSFSRISDSSKTKTWTEKLQNQQFKQWDEFVAAFNQFPN